MMTGTFPTAPPLRPADLAAQFARRQFAAWALTRGGPRHAPWREIPADHLQDRDRGLLRTTETATLLGDAVVIVAALIASFLLRFHTGMQRWGVSAHPSLGDYAGYLTLGAISLLATLSLMGLYERAAVLRYRFVASRVLKGSVIWVAAFMALATVFRFSPDVSRIYVALCALVVPGTLLAWRALLWTGLHRSSALVSLRQRVVFVGWNQQAERLAHFFAEAGSAYELVGCLQPNDAPLPLKPGTPVLGHVGDAEQILPRLGIDIVIVAEPDCARDEMSWLSNVCEKELAHFKVIPYHFEILVSGLHLETMKGVPVLGVSRLPLDRPLNLVLKRALDLVGAVVGFLLAVPLIGIFGTLVYLESPGPIIYRQRRSGRAGRHFDIYKIRSMKLNAEANGQVGWSTKDDPRRLRVGAFMRRWNIDELPQFWNVLTGEMSLVGPRPERPELIRNFKEEIAHYNARHNAKPGITGWAQVCGFRGDTDLSERIRCDLWYLEHWSLLLDLQIMCMTLLNNKNAA